MTDSLQNPAATVLVVEDNPNDAALVRTAAGRACPDIGFRFLTDGLQALAYLAGDGDFADRRAHPFPDVVLLDVRLPGLDGFEVLEHIRLFRHCSRLKVLLWSDAFDPCVAPLAKAAGAHDFVPKPSTFNQLLDELRRVADLARAPVACALA